MLRILILEEGDINVQGYGFNARLVQKDDFELIVQHTAVPELIKQLIVWQSAQDDELRERYLLEKEKFDLGFDVEQIWRDEANAITKTE